MNLNYANQTTIDAFLCGTDTRAAAAFIIALREERRGLLTRLEVEHALREARCHVQFSEWVC